MLNHINPRFFSFTSRLSSDISLFRTHTHFFESSIMLSGCRRLRAAGQAALRAASAGGARGRRCAPRPAARPAPHRAKAPPPPPGGPGGGGPRPPRAGGGGGGGGRGGGGGGGGRRPALPPTGKRLPLTHPGQGGDPRLFTAGRINNSPRSVRSAPPESAPRSVSFCPFGLLLTLSPARSPRLFLPRGSTPAAVRGSPPAACRWDLPLGVAAHCAGPGRRSCVRRLQ